MESFLNRTWSATDVKEVDESELVKKRYSVVDKVGWVVGGGHCKSNETQVHFNINVCLKTNRFLLT